MSADFLNLGPPTGDMDSTGAAPEPYSDPIDAIGANSMSSGPGSIASSGDEDSDFDGPSLKKVVQCGCKVYDLGTAVMPKLLLRPDVDELAAADEAHAGEDGYQLAPSAPQQSRYARTVEQEFTAIVIEHHLKWAPMCTAEPGPLPDGASVTDRLGRYDFGQVDAMVDWALERNLKVKGHVLIWAVSSPTSFLEGL
jgi:hypothetical protein